MKLRMIGIGLAVAGLSACTWVKVTPEARAVKAVTAAEVTNCQRLGTTTSQAAAKVGFINRNAGKLAYELEALARNEAVKMGGDVVVADSPVEEGRQRFIIYKCEQ